MASTFLAQRRWRSPAVTNKTAQIEVPKSTQQAVNTYVLHVASTADLEALDSNEQGIDGRSDVAKAMLAGVTSRRQMSAFTAWSEVVSIRQGVESIALLPLSAS